MSNFTPLKGNCPNCGGTRRDCRQSRDTDLIFCRHDEIAPNLRLVTVDAHGFNVLAEDDGQDNEAARREWRDRQTALKRQRIEQQAKSLSIAQRDRQFRQLIKHCSLSRKHQAKLADRGLTEEQIDILRKRGVLWTWQAGAEIPGTTPSLPGIDRRGKLRQFYGFAIAAVDAQGRILGYQIKPDNDAGYFWGSSQAIDGQSPALPNGELPIGVYRPAGEVAAAEINLGEGGLKPAIAALQYERIFIGAAGGNFASSPEQFRAALAALSLELGTKAVVLNADGGAVGNSHVMLQYAKTFALLEDWGYQVSIRWWGQLEKHHGDVDEIDSDTFHQAHLLTVDQFDAIAVEQQQKQWREQQAQKAREAWQQLKTYTPTHTFEQQFVSSISINSQLLGTDIHALKSDMGTGKTHALAELLKQFQGGAIAIGSRNSLLLQSCERWGDFYHLHQDNAFSLVADPNARIACCVDSLQHFQDCDFDGKVLILDEASSIVKHALLSGTLAGRRDACLSKFEEAVKRAAVVICWDGNNTDITVSYIRQLRGDNCKVVKALNQFKGDRLNVEMIRTVNDEGTVIRSSKAAMEKLEETLQAAAMLPAGTRRAIVVVADSQRHLEALDGVYSEQGFNVLRVDSKTITDPKIRAFLKNPDAYIAEHQPDIILLSPTAESGIDISIKGYWLKGFAFFYGILDTDTQKQILRRCRDCHDWIVSCPEYSLASDDGSRSPFMWRLLKQHSEYLEADAIAALAGQDTDEAINKLLAELRAALESPHAQTALKLEAARNFERQHTRECLQWALEQDGHQVTVVDVAPKSDALHKALKEERDRIITTESLAIFNADPISTSEAAKIKSSFNAGLEERHQAERALLLTRLPGIETTDQWSPELVAKALFKDRQWLKELERWWFLNHMDAAKNRARERWQAAIANPTGAGFPLDIRSDLLMLQALEELGIADLCDGQQRDGNSEDVQNIWGKCKRSKRLKTALGRSPGKLSPVDFVGRLAARVGIVSSGKMKPQSERGSGCDRNYTYSSPDVDPMAKAILQSYDLRFGKYLSEKTAETQTEKATEPDRLTRNNISDIGQGDPPQTPLHTGLYCSPLYIRLNHPGEWWVAAVNDAIATAFPTTGAGWQLPHFIPFEELQPIGNGIAA